jgi:aminoglycoside phosphotransferase (APT) family kinase protein
MHPDQITITEDLARALVDAQFPAWRSLAVTAVRGAGTVNAIFRIGDAYCARFPLVLTDPAETRRYLEAEAAATQELLGRTRFATPAWIAIGEPGGGYPSPWSVQTWIPGTTAVEQDPAGSDDFAHDLAEFIDGVRAISTRGRTFHGNGRGGELTAHDAWVARCFDSSEALLDVARLRALWSELRALPRENPDVMCHGDLIPSNVLVDHGRLAGILDVGGLGPADPALDLVAAWHLLDEQPRQVLRDDLGCSDLEWERGKAWAFEQAIGLVWYYVETNPAMSLLGRRTLERIVAAS